MQLARRRVIHARRRLLQRGEAETRQNASASGTKRYGVATVAGDVQSAALAMCVPLIFVFVLWLSLTQWHDGMKHARKRKKMGV